MADFLLPTLAVAALVLLVVAGVAHVRHPAALRDALDRQALLPPRTRSVVVRTLGPTELLLALLGAVRPAAGFLIALAGAAFALHLGVLLRLRPDAPCGCAGDEDSVSPFDLGRALVVLVGGLALVVRPGDLTGSEQLTVLVAGLALALAVDLVVRSQRSAGRAVLTHGRQS